MRKQTRAMQISQRASEKIPELQDAFGTSAVTLANLLYPWWGWLGTSCFSTFNYFAVASLSEVSPTLHVGVCARNWVCISPSLSSSLDLNGKDHLRLSGLLLELLHTHTVRCSCSTLCPGPGCHASTKCSLDPVWAPTYFPALPSIHRLSMTQCTTPVPATGSGHKCFNTHLSMKTVNFKQFYFTNILWENLLQ